MLRQVDGRITVKIGGTDFLLVALDDGLTLNMLQDWANEHALTVDKAVLRALTDAIHA